MKVYVDASPTKLCVLGEDGRKVLRDAAKPHTSNEAEYLAVITALELFPNVTEIFSSKQLVVLQLDGRYKVKKPELLFLWGRVQKVLNGRKVAFIWIPKADNPAGRLNE